MKVEIWSDVVCPWCYIGKRRIETALEGFEHRDEVEVQYRSFELNPDAPADEGGGLAERLASKYGVGLEQARAMNNRVTETAAKEGLKYNLDIARPGNTFDAHRLIHLAATEGRQAEMKERLMAAYFVEGKPIGDRATLVELAVEFGLNADRAQEVLASDEFASEVRAEEREADRFGITGSSLLRDRPPLRDFGRPGLTVRWPGAEARLAGVATRRPGLALQRGRSASAKDVAIHQAVLSNSHPAPCYPFGWCRRSSRVEQWFRKHLDRRSYSNGSTWAALSGFSAPDMALMPQPAWLIYLVSDLLTAPPCNCFAKRVQPSQG